MSELFGPDKPLSSDSSALEQSAAHIPETASPAGLAITGTDISVTIHGRAIVRTASFSVSEGECVGLIGPNGSGKTTLFNALSGFAPATGSIKLAQHELCECAPHERAQLGLGRVFQQSGVFRDMTIAENLLIARENSPRALSDEATRELLQEVKLAGREKELAGSLSGGQLRLLEIVRSIVSGAQVMLLDEPTAGVSPKMRDELKAILLHARKRGVTLLVIEHDMHFIFDLCSRILVMNEGQIVLAGKPEEIRKSPLLAEIYFGKQ